MSALVFAVRPVSIPFAHKGRLKIALRTHMTPSILRSALRKRPPFSSLPLLPEKKRKSGLYAPRNSLLLFLVANFQNVLPKCFGFHFPFYARNTPLYYKQELWLLLSAGTRTIPNRFALSSGRITHFACISRESPLCLSRSPISFSLHRNATFFFLPYSFFFFFFTSTFYTKFSSTR